MSSPSARLLVLIPLAIALGVALPAAEGWQLTLPASPPVRAGVAFTQPRDLAAQRLRIAGEWDALTATAWLEATLSTADGRFYATRANLPVRPGSSAIELPLTAEHWGGADGPLDSDAAAAVTGLEVRLHGGPERREGLVVDLALLPPTTVPAPTGPRLVGPGLIDRGPWRELHLQLTGVATTSEVDLVLADGRRIPCFVDRRLVADLGRLRALGPDRWTARLRPDEPLAAGWRVVVDGLPGPVQAALGPAVPSEREPPPATGLPAFPITPGGRAAVVAYGPAGGPRVERELAPAPAPRPGWRADWSGFRGAHLPSHAAGAELDRLLLGADAPAALDLLPQSLLEESSSYRFELAPWTTVGRWDWPGDVLADAEGLTDLRAQVRHVVARARAAPSLRQWRVSCRHSVTDPAAHARLQALCSTIVALTADDGRELLVEHPQLVAFAAAKDERQAGRVWCDFERSTDGWRGRAGSRVALTTDHASSGRVSLGVELAATSTGEPAFRIARELDADVFNLDRLEFDARADGDGTVALFAWVTDDEHRWYQQRLGSIAAGRGWQRVHVDFAPHAEWTAVGHAVAWDGTQRRRIREIGLLGSVHDRSGGGGDFAIDALVRRGWPLQPEPELALTEPDAVPSRLAAHETLAVDFALSHPAANPYDPESADVVAVITAPDGRRFRYPAYWDAHVDTRVVEDSEAIERAHGGQWCLRYAPTQPGEWRWQLEARLAYRDRALTVRGPEHRLTVAEPRPETLLPVRRSADPRYWETSDGEFFYPLGINLRSPGDDRQNRAMADAGSDLRSRDFEAMGLAAYERWFARMAANGMNYARVWMSPWWCGLEWTREWNDYGGLTVYNQVNAARLDAICEMAERHGIYLQIEIQNHGMTSENVDAQWANSPYNLRNGGPCRNAAEFFAGEEAWAAHAKRLRYTIARYGHHSHIMAWVLSSELEFTGSWARKARGDDGHDPVTTAWVERNLAWFENHDPLSERPVSIHFSHPWRAERLWRHPGLGFSNSNAYTGFQTNMNRLGGRQAGLATALTTYLGHHFPPWRLARPTLVGEWGGHWSEEDHETLAAELHTGLWMQSVLPYGGNVGFWWWLWLDATDRWDRYAAVARFLADDDPRGHDTRILQGPTRGGSHPCDYVGMQGRGLIRLYAWRSGLSRDLAVGAATLGGEIHLSALEPGSHWRLERWDCQRGEPVSEREVQADADGTLTLALGRLAPDAAFKLDRLAPAVNEAETSRPRR